MQHRSLLARAAPAAAALAAATPSLVGWAATAGPRLHVCASAAAVRAREPPPSPLLLPPPPCCTPALPPLITPHFLKCTCLCLRWRRLRTRRAAPRARRSRLCRASAWRRSGRCGGCEWLQAEAGVSRVVALACPPAHSPPGHPQALPLPARLPRAHACASMQRGVRGGAARAQRHRGGCERAGPGAVQPGQVRVHECQVLCRLELPHSCATEPASPHTHHSPPLAA